MTADDVHESKKARHSYPSGSDANTTTPRNACQQVSSARARLSHTTHDYLAACQLLASTCEQQPRPFDQDSRELVISAIDTELLTLKEEEERIQKAHQVLVNARNRAKMTASIYSLPPETLTRIFLEAACHHAHDESKRPTCFPSSPVTLSAVCRLWRNVATDFCLLWAHLDILIGATSYQPRYPSSQLWTNRLKETPLRIHIRQCDSTLYQRPGNPGHSIRPNSMNDSDDSDDSDSSVFAQYPVPGALYIPLSSLIEFLIPLMLRVDSLELISDLHCQTLLYLMLECLIDGDEGPVPMKTVRFIHGRGCSPLQFKTSHSSIERYSGAHKAFFGSLTTLDLRNVYPRWGHLTLTNLVELRFEAPTLEEAFSVTQAELAATLTSCPKLRSLMLFSLRVTPAPAGARSRSVVLDDLRVLSLRRMAWGGELERVISIIHPGPHHLHLSIHLPERHKSNPDLLAELRSFFRRSNVSVFYAEDFTLHTWFASQLGPLPNVHTLILNACHVSDVAGFSIDRHVNPCPINPSVVLWPQLRNLYLIHCGMENAHLHRLLSLHTIQKLYLHRCFDDTLLDVDVLITPQFLEECRLLLSDLTPNIEIIVNDAHDDTVDWLFVGTPM